MNARLSFVFYTHSEKLKLITMCFSNLHRRNYCPVNKETQSLCDVLIGRELLLSDDWTFYDKPWGIGLVAIFLSFVAETNFGLQLSS